MPHFSVLVVGKNVDYQLDLPEEDDLSDGEISLDAQARFETCIPEEKLEDAFRDWRLHKIDYIRVISCKKDLTDNFVIRDLISDTEAAKILSLPDSDIPIPKINSSSIQRHKHLLEMRIGDKNHERYIARILDEYNSPELWAKEYMRMMYSDEHSAWGYYYNSNDRWDWYEIGGKWAGYLILKPDVDRWSIELVYDDYTVGEDGRVRVSAAYMNEIDWDYMRLMYRRRAEEEWEMLHNREDMDFIITSGLLSRDQFIKEYGSVSTSAILWDRKWYERGMVGDKHRKNIDDWEKEFNSILSIIPDDEWLTIVDCYIYERR